MTIPEIEEAFKKQRLEMEKLSKLLSDTVENIKEFRHQIGVPCAPQCGDPEDDHNPRGGY